jgi:hypothetical protein
MKQIPSLPEGYLANKSGDIYCTRPLGNPTHRERGPTKPRKMKQTYKHVNTMVIGIRGRAIRVGPLMLETFVGPRPEGMECRHLNGNFRDNRLVNLAWGTHSENMRDMLRHGTSAQGTGKLSPAQVLNIRERHAQGELQREIAEDYGISRRLVGMIAKKERYSWV